MGTPLFIRIPSGTGGDGTNPSANTISVSATSASSYQSVGHNQIIRIVAAGPINIRFGPATTTTATASDLYLPGNTVELFDLGRSLEGFVVYNPGASSVSVWWSVVSRV